MKCLLFIATTLFSLNISAQTKKPIKKTASQVSKPIAATVSTTNITIGDRAIAVKGTVFNSIAYNFSSGKSKLDYFYFIDKKLKKLEITEVEYEYEGDVSIAKVITINKCPFAKINKKESYNIDMDDAAVENKKYTRLTLLSTGQSMDNSFFEQVKVTRYDTEIEKKLVNNATVNVVEKTNAEKWLKEFTKIQ